MSTQGQRLAYEITVSEIRHQANTTANEMERLSSELVSRLDGADDEDAVLRLAEALRAAVHALRYLGSL